MTRPTFSCVSASALVSMLLVVPSSAAGQQPEWWAVDLTQPALSLVEATRAAGGGRIGVLPVTAATPDLVRVANDVTSQLMWALQAVPHTSPGLVAPIDRPAASKSASVAALTVRLPLSSNETVQLGRQADVTYVVAGTVVPSRTELPSRVELSIVDVRTGATIQTASASFSFPATPSMDMSRPVWKSKAFVGAAGALATAFTSVLAWRANQDVKARKAELLALPPGVTDEWTRLHDEASGVAKDRDFWWGVTAGLAAVTTSYLVLAGSSQITAFPASPDSWQVAVDPTRRQVLVRRSF
jgi:hypothetical protein